MNNSKSRRFLALLQALVVVIGCVPVSAFATGDENAASEIATVSFNVNGGVGEYENQVVTIGEKVTEPEQNPLLR